jgi:hypothetical protein
MEKLDQLFRPRRELQVQSHRKSTVDSRNRQYRRTGLSAAIMKIKSKWSGRKIRAKKDLMGSTVYQRLEVLDPGLCKQYINEVETKFGLGCNAELQRVATVFAAQSISDNCPDLNGC